VFRLPSDLLAKVDDGIQAGRWISRDAFARIAFAEAIGTHATKTTGTGKPVNGAAGKRRLEGAGRDATVRG
jgi:Arc/MetJ-type ribon-helix-helix transcriptional regulator